MIEKKKRVKIPTILRRVAPHQTDRIKEYNSGTLSLDELLDDIPNVVDEAWKITGLP